MKITRKFCRKCGFPDYLDCKGLCRNCSTPLKIVASAIQYQRNTFTGVRHCEIISDLVRLGYPTPIGEGLGYVQGFVCENNHFHTRENALTIVENSGQHYEPRSSTLTSEDLW